MSNPFFDHPILNSPYERPPRHWELDEQGQPTQRIIESRRRADFITPIPKPKKRTSAPNQKAMVFDEGLGLSTATQAYDPTSIINELRQLVDQWRDLQMRIALGRPRHFRQKAADSVGLQRWRKPALESGHANSIAAVASCPRAGGQALVCVPDSVPQRHDLHRDRA
jgi:type III restriction enzyme